MKRSKFKEPKAVLVFNGTKILIGILRSINSASQLSGNSAQSISFACTGKYISTGGFYYRHLHQDIEVTFDDVDNLNLIDYDEMCGEKRKYHSLRGMAKIRNEKQLLSKSLKTNKKNLNNNTKPMEGQQDD